MVLAQLYFNPSRLLREIANCYARKQKCRVLTTYRPLIFHILFIYLFIYLSNLKLNFFLILIALSKKVFFEFTIYHKGTINNSGIFASVRFAVEIMHFLSNFFCNGQQFQVGFFYHSVYLF